MLSPLHASKTRRSLLAQLAGQHAQGHQRPLCLAVPRRAAVKANTVVKLFRITEDDSRCNADALLQRTHVQFLGIDPTRQTDPQDKAAGWTGHLGTFGEILLHRQLEGAEVLAVFLADVAQVAVVATVFQVSRDTHLGNTAC